MADIVTVLRASPPSAPQIYLVISQTGTLLSRILKAVTGAEYNHISLSLSPDLKRMYSFGRRHAYNPFWAGFVVKSPHSGTFKRFPKTKAVVLALPVSNEAYQAISLLIRGMLSQQGVYHYNYLGLLFAAAHIQYRKKYCYYCSEFVKDILLQVQVNGSEQLAPIVQPIHFMEIPGGQKIYCGYLRDYPASPAKPAAEPHFP